ncbi:Acyl-CoA synthetase family member 2, mitochondrial [Armadillidium nasatum]|uniref:Medium-chain acyl-CoA ligase ACSF2, mitochondrial n=1 Tax=Armadillidium nasatum TaxID=96803 RepID=A0A5N5THS9_9CRUS|nr:Acyl-CoA synthetase family member 2, mitochondrial [Armadillidium nasatum]
MKFLIRYNKFGANYFAHTYRKLISSDKHHALPLIRIQRKSTCKNEWSYAMGPSDVPLLGLTIGKALDQAAESFGDTEAVVSIHQSIRRTFSQVKEESEKLAAGFLALGFKRGDRIGIWGPNSYEWYLMEFAAAKAGLILVNINPSYRSGELKYCLNKVSVKGIVCATKFKTSDYYKMLNEIAPELSSSPAGQLTTKDIPNLKTVIMMGSNSASGTYSFDSILGFAGSGHFDELSELERKIQFDEPCNIQFTSGTTGLPKAALLSHHNVINNGFFFGKRCGYDLKPLRICVPTPLYHCIGCVLGVLASVLHGCTVVFANDAFDPKAIVKSFEEERINSCYGTPTMFVDILREFRINPVKVDTLSFGLMGGAPCPEELVTAMAKELNMDILVAYGMTETSPVSFQCFLSDSLAIKSQTIGYPLDHVEVKIVNENNEIVRTGESGELLIRGYCNFLERGEISYPTYENYTYTRADLATMNEDGYGAIIGRIKDMIIRGGENIYPAEIENFYMSHPDIIEAQVFGVPDERMGEEVALWVRLVPGSKLSEEDIRNWSKGKIAHYKIPRYIREKSEFPSHCYRKNTKIQNERNGDGKSWTEEVIIKK